MGERAAIILAAGVSSRMNTMMPKVLHEVCGRPMLAYVHDACREVGVEKIYVVVGFSAEQVKERFGEFDGIEWVIQEEQLGTAHAVLCCKDYLEDVDGQTLVLCGDGPLIRSATLTTLKNNTKPLSRYYTLPQPNKTLTIKIDPPKYQHKSQ